MSLTLTLKGRLIMETGSHIPLFSFLAAFWEQWVIAERLGFVPRVRLDEVHAPTTANTQAPTQTCTHTAVGYSSALWGPPPRPPALSRSLYLTLSSGLRGLCSTRNIQLSRCCLSGPAANIAWWDHRREDYWHGSACPAATPAQGHARTTLRTAHAIRQDFIYFFVCCCPFFLLSCT